MLNKPFHTLELEELAKLDPALVEYQLQEGVGGLSFHQETAKTIVASAIEIVELRKKLQRGFNKKHTTEEWWATFRAALTGAMTQWSDPQQACRQATAAADNMHGTLSDSKEV